MPARTDVVRLNINLPVEAAAVLKDLADKRQISVTETVRRAIALLKFVDDEVISTPGASLEVHDPSSDKVTKVALVP